MKKFINLKTISYFQEEQVIDFIKHLTEFENVQLVSMRFLQLE
ncbi:MAG: hypothetical protein R2876_05310 [Eubacteriales bacterium]